MEPGRGCRARTETGGCRVDGSRPGRVSSPSYAAGTASRKVASTASWTWGLRISSGTRRPTEVTSRPKSRLALALAKSKRRREVDGDHRLGHGSQNHQKLLPILIEPGGPGLDFGCGRVEGPTTGPAVRRRVVKTDRALAAGTKRTPGRSVDLGRPATTPAQNRPRRPRPRSRRMMRSPSRAPSPDTVNCGTYRLVVSLSSIATTDRATAVSASPARRSSRRPVDLCSSVPVI